MNWYHPLYQSENLKKKEHEIIAGIEGRQDFLHTYVIILSQQMEEQLEVIHVAVTQQEALEYDSMWIVGVAVGKQEALRLVERIANDVYQATGKLEIKNYFLANKSAFKVGSV